MYVKVLFSDSIHIEPQTLVQQNPKVLLQTAQLFVLNQD